MGRMFKTGGLLSILLLFCVFQVRATSHWWLKGDLLGPDPTIIKQDSLWWVMQTGIGIPVKYSTNGLSWTSGGKLFANPLSWWAKYAPGMSPNDVWSPDLHFYNGRIWCYYSVSQFGKNTSAIGLASCSKMLSGDWRDDGLVISSNASSAYNAIDPNLTLDSEGEPWLVFGSWYKGIYLTRINKSTMKPTGVLYPLAKRDGGIEAPVIVYRNGYYYLFVSLGTCCNGLKSTSKIAYGRSKNITGPYVDKNGNQMLLGGSSLLDSGNSRWVAPGGQDVYPTGSGYVLARHAYDATDHGAPKLLISDLDWIYDWPSY